MGGNLLKVKINASDDDDRNGVDNDDHIHLKKSALAGGTLLKVKISDDGGGDGVGNDDIDYIYQINIEIKSPWLEGLF